MMPKALFGGHLTAWLKWVIFGLLAATFIVVGQGGRLAHEERFLPRLSGRGLERDPREGSLARIPLPHLQRAREPGVDARDHIGQQATRKSVQRFGLGRPRFNELPVGRGELLLQLVKLSGKGLQNRVIVISNEVRGLWAGICGGRFLTR